MEGINALVKRHFVNLGLPALLLVHVLLLFNVKFTAWPEMINWPYLMLNNFLPYRDIAIAHNPFLLFILSSFYKFVGVGIWELQVFTWMIIILGDILLFYVIEKLINPKVAVISLAFFIPWQIFYDGNGMWFDLFMTPFVLASFYFVRAKKYLLAGSFWAIAFLTKQTTVWFLIPLLLEMKNTAWQISNIKKAFFGALIVIGVFLFFILSFGVFREYIFWTVEFGVFTLPISVGQISLPNFQQTLFYLFPFAPLTYLIWKKKTEEVLLVVWTIAGVLSVYPRFELFHFQPALPFLTISFSVLLAKYFNSAHKITRNLFLCYLVVSSFIVGRFLINNYHKDIRFFDTQTLKSADYIKKLTWGDENTYFLNVWDNIYFLTNTLPATKPLIPHLSWYMELPHVQEEIVESLRNASPKYIFVGEFTGGILSAYIPKQIYTYITSEYKVVNVVNDITIYKR